MISPRLLLTGGQLVLLAMAALFSAMTVNAMIAGRLRGSPSLRVTSAPALTQERGARTVADYAAITQKDIFNPPRPAEPEITAPQVSELKARLLGTAPTNGMDSFAIIEDQNNRQQQLYRVGDQFQNRTLIGVAWDHVVLRNGTREEILNIIEPSGNPAPASPVASAASGQGIQQRGDNEFVIDRAEVDKAMENLNTLFTQIRAVPHFQDGKASGFRLFAIRQDSIFEKIGLKNGDIVNTINGNELTDPARAMSLIQELRNEGRISVSVLRNRQPTNLSYEIR